MDSKPYSGFLDLRGEAYSYVEEGPFPLIEPGKRIYLKDRGRDVRGAEFRSQVKDVPTFQTLS